MTIASNVFPVCILSQRQAALLFKHLNDLFLTRAEKVELEKVKEALGRQLVVPTTSGSR